jgi:hypothetical protein
MDLDFVTVASKAWELFDFGMNGAPRNAYTDAVVRLSKAMQTPEGYWTTNESRRALVGSGEFQTAALAIYSIRHYASVGDEAASERAAVRAVKWLKAAKPRSTQDRAFHLLGLAWGRESGDGRCSRACGNAASRWRLGPAAEHRVRRLCDWTTTAHPASHRRGAEDKMSDLRPRRR